MNVQMIKRNGQPEWVVLPYNDYLKLVEQAEMLQDIQDFDQAMAAIANGQEEVIPGEVVTALIEGEHPVKVWREYRHLTQQQLANEVGISVPFLSQIETGKRKASTRVMAALAKALQVAVDDLIPEG